MNRIYKFRAWDPDEKEMQEQPYICCLGGGGMEIEFAEEDGNFRPAPNAILEQYTGLKDKNGKEGYDYDKVSFGETQPIFQIKWSMCNAEFYLESMDDRKEVLHISNLTVGKIIGNIHDKKLSGETNIDVSIDDGSMSLGEEQALRQFGIR